MLFMRFVLFHLNIGIYVSYNYGTSYTLVYELIDVEWRSIAISATSSFMAATTDYDGKCVCEA